MRAEAAARGLVELAMHLRLPGPPRVIEAFDVSTLSGAHSVASMVCAVDGHPRPGRYRRFRLAGVEGVDDPRMVAEVVRRRYARLQEAGATLPDLVLVDGGLTQLRAARAELSALGLGTLPVIGLAKRYEELYVEGAGDPLRLPAASDALNILKRLRDEAHRFAITHHRGLRSRRLRESALDDVPGVGPAKKMSLLRRFGSVQSIRRASEDDLAAVPGVGLSLARAIRAALRVTSAGRVNP
jgi:excinuclease ABC subunit C